MTNKSSIQFYCEYKKNKYNFALSNSKVIFSDFHENQRST